MNHDLNIKTVARTEASEPVYFGDAERPLFGWIHRPVGVPPSSIGLVICKPFGFDAICSHRGVRHLATAAAAGGFPSIRFDYDGTGDSAGSDSDANRVDAWLRSIHLAADALKTRCGVQQLCVIGLRLGALLASQVVAQRSDIIGFGLVSPVVRGRAYIRELRAFQIASITSEESEAGLLESAGYIMTPETVASIESLSIEAPTRTSMRVLILDRDDLPVANKAAESFRSLDIDVRYATTPDHSLLVRSPTPVELPMHVIENCVQWLTEFPRQNAAETPPLAARTTATFRVADNQVTESVTMVVAQSPLFAVTVAPAAQTLNTHTAVLLLNAGAVNHIGPSRMYVDLSRQWAAQGFTCMRLDIAGIGDSAPPNNESENVIYAAHACANVASAVDALKKSPGIEKVVIVGLCSGAYHAFLSAKQGLSIDSIVMLNPLTFNWQDGTPLDEGELSPKAAVAAVEAQRYKSSILRLSTWKKLVTGKADVLSFAKVLLTQFGSKTAALRRELRRALGGKVDNDLAADFQTIARNGVQATLIFGSTDLGLPRMQAMGGWALARQFKKGPARLKIIPGADHIFMQLKHRKQLAAMLTELLTKNQTKQ